MRFYLTWNTARSKLGVLARIFVFFRTIFSMEWTRVLLRNAMFLQAFSVKLIQTLL